MIAQAILSSDERSGISRDAIWKYLVLMFPKATSNERGKKLMLAKLKKFADDGRHIKYGKTRGRFAINSNFRNQIALRKAKGLGTVAASNHVLLNKSFNRKKPMTTNKKNTRAKTEKGKSKNEKKKSKDRKAKDTKRRTKAADTKKSKAKGAAGKPKGKGKSPAKGRKPSTSPAKGKKQSTSQAKGRK